MAWIKFEKDLQSDPRVLRMARILDRRLVLFDQPEDFDPCNASALPAVTLVCGALVRLWCLADSHVGQDDVLDLSAEEVDDYIGIKDFCQIMPDDWLEVGDGFVKLPGFHAHNGTEAKKKAVTQKRVERHRKRNAQALQPVTLHALPDQTKTRPDQTNKETMSATPTVPPDVQQVFEHWKQAHGHQKARLDPKRVRVIREALKFYKPDELCRSISGYLNSPHHMGENERRTRYDDIEIFLRDAKHIDAGLKLAEQGRKTQWQ